MHTLGPQKCFPLSRCLKVPSSGRCQPRFERSVSLTHNERLIALIIFPCFFGEEQTCARIFLLFRTTNILGKKKEKAHKRQGLPGKWLKRQGNPRSEEKKLRYSERTDPVVADPNAQDNDRRNNIQLCCRVKILVQDLPLL